MDSFRQESRQLASRTVGPRNQGENCHGTYTGSGRTFLIEFRRPLTSLPAFANIQSPMKHIGENVVRIEAAALHALADRIAGPMAETFNSAVELLCACRGRVVVTGMGKSGIIARKIAAPLDSTGTPALFMHPVEAVAGESGKVWAGGVGGGPATGGGAKRDCAV